jgi:hypothetical protein
VKAANKVRSIRCVPRAGTWIRVNCHLYVSFIQFKSIDRNNKSKQQIETTNRNNDHKIKCKRSSNKADFTFF